jgi:hypothetical protein
MFFAIVFILEEVFGLLTLIGSLFSYIFDIDSLQEKIKIWQEGLANS